MHVYFKVSEYLLLSKQGLRSAFLTRKELPTSSKKFCYLRKAGERTPPQEFRSIEQDRVSGFNAKLKPWQPFVHPLSLLNIDGIPTQFP
jgi:hypothetical protein